MTQLTPQILIDKGFKYSSPGKVSGCDMFHGMAFWVSNNKDLVLRGNISTASGGSLCLWAKSNIVVDNVEELDMLLKLVR